MLLFFRGPMTALLTVPVRTSSLSDESRQHGWLVYTVHSGCWKRSPTNSSSRRSGRAGEQSLVESQEMGLRKHEPSLCAVGYLFFKMFSEAI